MASGVLCAGNLVFDILVRPVREVRFGSTTWVDSIDQSMGGNGANTSYTLGRLGVRVRLLGAAGRDVFGDAVVGRLAEAGVDTGFVLRCEEPTATTVALVGPDGGRAFLHRPGASREAFSGPVEFPSEVTEGHRRFHLANPFGLPKMRRHAGETLRRAKAAGLATSVDTGWDACGEWMEVLGPCLPHTDLLFVNQDEARMLTGREDPEEAASHFRERGAAVVVVKMGGDGCGVAAEGSWQVAPAFEIEVVDTTGAGDCHAGGFLAALEWGATLEQAAEFANGVAGMSAGSLGATTGVRSREETKAWIAGAKHRTR